MQRTQDTMTLNAMVRMIGDDGDTLYACMTSLGLTSVAANDPMWIGSLCDEWGLNRSDLRRQVSLTLDSHGNIDNESCPVWAD